MMLAKHGFLSRLSKLPPSKDVARNVAVEILELARQAKKLRHLTRRLAVPTGHRAALFGLVSEWPRYKLMNKVLEIPCGSGSEEDLYNIGFGPARDRELRPNVLSRLQESSKRTRPLEKWPSPERGGKAVARG